MNWLFQLEGVWVFQGFQLNTICLNRARGWLLQLLPLGSLIPLRAR